ncbi:MAG: FHA domain-containing protein [Pseudomonadota bacterium]|nr:FHA domain-containing protein [Pseudomonadota bacterium]
MSRKKKHQPRVQEVDLEATAELPLMDFGAPAPDPAESTGDGVADGATDTFLALAMPEVVPDLTDSLREVETSLMRKTERLRELEGQLAAAEAERSAALELVERTRSQTQALIDEERATAARTAEGISRRLATAEQSLALAQGARTGDIEELRRRAERQAEALRHTQGIRGVFDAMLAEREEQVAALESRHAADLAGSKAQVAAQMQEAAAREAALAAELESLRSATTAREVELEARLQERDAELATARQQLEAAAAREQQLAGEAEAQSALVARQESELAELRANEEAAAAAVQMFAQQQERLRALEGELVAARERATSLESELRAARERIERLQTDARASASLLGNLQQNIARLGKEEAGARPALKVVGGTDQLPQRFLVSEEGSQRHELARRSTIGRTPENDIQIDANFVSRRHAVILGSPQHCIIEDLESVNGVQVNGRRVTRHFLRDGDVVTIGRTTFRFQESSQ